MHNPNEMLDVRSIVYTYEVLSESYTRDMFEFCFSVVNYLWERIILWYRIWMVAIDIVYNCPGVSMNCWNIERLLSHSCNMTVAVIRFGSCVCTCELYEFFLKDHMFVDHLMIFYRLARISLSDYSSLRNSHEI